MKIFLTLFSILFFATLANADTTGVIHGKVLWKEGNKTTPKTGVTLQLTAYQNGKAQSAERTKSNSRGEFRFSKLDPSSDLAYEISAIHEGVPFKKPRVGFENRSEIQLEDFVLYPFTNDPKNLEIQEILLFEFGQTDILKINHSLVVTNNGKQTYDSHGAAPFDIPLAKGGFQLHFLSGVSQQSLDLIPNETCLRLNRAIEPGEANQLHLEFNYLYQYDARNIEFDFPWKLPRSKTTIALIDQDYDIEGPGLVQGEPKEQNGATFYVYTGGPFTSEQPLQFTLEGLPLPGDEGKHAVQLGMLFLALLGLFLLVKMRPKTPEKSQNRKTLALKQLAAIHEYEKRGELSSEEARTRQSYWKNVWVDAELSEEKDTPNT